MSQFEKIMAQLDDIKTQNAWLVSAVKYLLQKDLPEGDWEPEALLEEHDLDLEDDDMSEFEHIAVRAPRKPPQCTHGHQVLVDGVVRCARCGTALNSSGVMKPTLTPSGQIQQDPNPPPWALQHSPGASSKNPWRSPDASFGLT